ncbi:MAG: AI-2E family transporter [Pyrinomonadaceae bacterium]
MADEDIKKTGVNMAGTPDTEIEPSTVRVELHKATPSVNSIVRVVVVTLVLLFVAGFVANVISSLTYLFFLLVLSIFFAYLISPLVKLIRSPFKGGSFERLMPRSVAILIAYVIVFAVLGLGISNLAPIVIEQGKEFGTNLPNYAGGVRQTFNDLNRRFDRLRIPEDVQTKINEQAVGVGERITAGFGNFLLALVTYLPWLVLVPILAFFFLKDVNLVRLAVLRVFPAGMWRMRAEAVMYDVNATLAAYTRAQLISCVIIGTICTIGFYVIGLKYALLLGILAGVFEFVPLLGPAAIGLIVTTTAAFSDNPWKALYVFIFLVVLRVIHDYVTYPRIVRGGLHLHPVLIIISVLAGEQVAGIPGVFLAIPIVAILTVLYRHVLEHKGSTGLVKELLEPAITVTEENPT